MTEEQQSPQEHLEKLGIACTEDNLFRYVAVGDVLVVDLLLKSGIRASAKNAEGRTALFLASINGQVDIARRLIEQGADPIDVSYSPQPGYEKEGRLGQAVRTCFSGYHPFKHSDSDRWRMVHILV